MYFLDTNTCIYFLNGTYESIKERVLATPPAKIAIPVIVKAELLFGAYKSKQQKRNIEKVEQFLEPFEIVPFMDSITPVYARIRSEVEQEGKRIGPHDLLIASLVKFHEGILVTNNIAEFQRIKGLKIANWAT